MTHHADHPATGGFAFCDPAPVFLPTAPVFSPVARFSRVASRAEPAPRSTIASSTIAGSTVARTTTTRTTMTAPPLEGTAVSTTPSSDVRPEGARL